MLPIKFTASQAKCIHLYKNLRTKFQILYYIPRHYKEIMLIQPQQEIVCNLLTKRIGLTNKYFLFYQTLSEYTLFHWINRPQ